MRVLHLVHNYFPSVGGSQLLIQKVAEGLTARGDDVSVFTTNALRNPSFLRNEMLPAGGVEIGEVDVQRFPFWRKPLPLLKQVNKLARRGPRILHEYLEPLCLGPISPRMYRAVRETPADVIACMSFPFLHMHYVHAGPDRPRVVLFGALHIHDGHVAAPVLRAIARSDAYIAFTAFERDVLVAHGAPADRIHVVGLGVDVATFAAASGAELRARHGIGSAPLVAFVGRQAAYKGCDTLIAAMHDVWRAHPDAWLVLAGSRTPFSPALDAMIAELPAERRAHVLVIADFPEAEKARWYAACDVFASVSTEESFGISFVEAWAAGKPVIGGRIGAIECVIRDGVDGLLVPCRDPEALAAAITRLLGDPALRARLGAAGAAKVRADHDWPAVVDKIRAIYAGIA